MHATLCSEGHFQSMGGNGGGEGDGGSGLGGGIGGGEGGAGGGEGDGGGGLGGGNGGGEGRALAKDTVLPKSTGSHCGGTATGGLTSADLLATPDLVMCGVKAAWKAAATPMRTSARKPGASCFAGFLVLFVKSFGTGNVRFLLC